MTKPFVKFLFNKFAKIFSVKRNLFKFSDKFPVDSVAWIRDRRFRRWFARPPPAVLRCRPVPGCFGCNLRWWRHRSVGPRTAAGSLWRWNRPGSCRSQRRPCPGGSSWRHLGVRWDNDFIVQKNIWWLIDELKKYLRLDWLVGTDFLRHFRRCFRM